MMSRSHNPHPQLPLAIRSERGVLGALIVANELWDKAKALTEEDFCLDSHQRIFACIRSRLAIGRPLDLILAMGAMERQKELEKVGGPTYLAELSEGIPWGNFSIASHIDVLKEKAALRRLIRLCDEGVKAAYDEQPSQEIIAALKEGFGL